MNNMDDARDLTRLAFLSTRAISILRALVGGKSAVLSKTAQPVVRRQVQELLKEWDATPQPKEPTQ